MNEQEEMASLEADVRAAVEGTSPQADVPAAEPVEAGPSRDEQGRFAPKVDSKSELMQSQPSGTEPAKTILPPHSWTATAKAKFNSLDPDVQAEVLRREKEIDDGKAQWDTQAQEYNRYKALYDPIRDRLTLSGIDQFAYTQALIKADELLRTNPQQGFQQLAQLYGFNPNQGFAQQPQQYQAPADPALQALQQQVQQLTQHVTSQNQAKEQAERQTILSEIEAFRTDPKNLYFDNVKPAMVKLLESGVCETIAEAYDLACYRDPDVKAALAVKPVVKAQPGKPRDISVTGAPGQATQNRPTSQLAGIEDDVRAAMRELGGRV